MIIKAEAKTNEYYGKEPEDRTIEELLNCGIVVIDKPKGPTSHQVSIWVREMLELRKAGHSGTLDPNVSGVLPIGLNKGARILGFLHYRPKEYVCLMKLEREVEQKKIRRTFESFLGTITQMPPKESAVKKRLRKRNIYKLKILEVEGERVLFRVECQSGTYIRTLCWDIGKVLRCRAEMEELRRTAVGKIDDPHNLYELKDAWVGYKEGGEEAPLKKLILPVEHLIEIPRIVVRDSCISALCHGSNLYAQGIVALDEEIHENGPVAIFTLKNELVGFGKALSSAKEIYEKNSGLSVLISKVMMEKSTYPKLWKG